RGGCNPRARAPSQGTPRCTPKESPNSRPIRPRTGTFRGRFLQSEDAPLSLRGRPKPFARKDLVAIGGDGTTVASGRGKEALMRRTGLLLALFVVAVFAASPRETHADTTVGVNLFFDNLAPYGDWFEME